MSEPAQKAPAKGPHPAPAPRKSPGDVVAHPAAERLGPRRAAPRPRHYAALASFFLMVVAPTVAAFIYLYGYAADQYASRVAFSVRGPETVAPIEILGALTQGGGGGADAQIVYDFVRSQQMVDAVRARAPLESIYNLPENDVIFRLGEDQPVETLVDYWNWMTDVTFESGSGIVHFEARAFDPESARLIATVVLEESTRVVNSLSEQARADAISVAAQVVAEAEDRLRDVRRALRAFRDIEQELDPSENARAAMGLVAALEADLARTQVELETQQALVGPQGPRIALLTQTIASLQNRIAQERARVGAGAQGAVGRDGRSFSDLVAEYEDLVVDREFAENAYVSALAAYEAAQVEARRQSRYLAAHIEPTLSMEAQYPQRALIGIGVLVALITAWAVALLIAYNIRDRR